MPTSLRTSCLMTGVYYGVPLLLGKAMRATENDTVLPHNVTLAKELPSMKTLRRAVQVSVQPIVLRIGSYRFCQVRCHNPERKTYRLGQSFRILKGGILYGCIPTPKSSCDTYTRAPLHVASVTFILTSNARQSTLVVVLLGRMDP